VPGLVNGAHEVGGAVHVVGPKLLAGARSGDAGCGMEGQLAPRCGGTQSGDVCQIPPHRDGAQVFDLAGRGVTARQCANGIPLLDQADDQPAPDEP
jgi:hypothetical protein